MKKKRNKPYRPRGESWTAIQIALMSASNQPQDDSAHAWLATEAYSALERLVGGIFTLQDFVTVSKLNAFAYMLAVEIYPGLADESRAAVLAQKDAIEQAAHALTSIGERHGRTSKFGATGEELAAIRESLGLMDALAGYANRGETIRAMTKADQMTHHAIRANNLRIATCT